MKEKEGPRKRTKDREEKARQRVQQEEKAKERRDKELNDVGEAFFLASSYVTIAKQGKAAGTYVPFNTLLKEFRRISGIPCDSDEFQTLLDNIAITIMENNEAASVSEDEKLEVITAERKRSTNVYRGKRTKVEWVYGVDLTEGRGEDSASPPTQLDREKREEKEERGRSRQGLSPYNGTAVTDAKSRQESAERSRQCAERRERPGCDRDAGDMDQKSTRKLDEEQEEIFREKEEAGPEAVVKNEMTVSEADSSMDEEAQKTDQEDGCEKGSDDEEMRREADDAEIVRALRKAEVEAESEVEKEDKRDKETETEVKAEREVADAERVADKKTEKEVEYEEAQRRVQNEDRQEDREVDEQQQKEEAKEATTEIDNEEENRVDSETEREEEKEKQVDNVSTKHKERDSHRKEVWTEVEKQEEKERERAVQQEVEEGCGHEYVNYENVPYPDIYEVDSDDDAREEAEA